MLTPVIVNALPKAIAGSDSLCAWHSHSWLCTWIDAGIEAQARVPVPLTSLPRGKLSHCPIAARSQS